ncbi:MAG: class I SAM-dependent methyltransferase [Methanoregulaceae archaeon]|jgi:ubiquinone/menaquinone biosynthesis C-methylase UbiE
MIFTELNITDDIEAFNRRSNTYEDSWLQRLYFDHIHKGVLGLVNVESAPVSILDVGCGTGRLLRKARERWPNARLIGVDPAEGMVKKARLMMPDSTFMVSPAESISLPDMSVDLVFSTASFHHWSDQLQGMDEISRVLRPGGQFLLADIVFPPFLLRFIHHRKFRNHSEVREMFEQAGLEVHLQRRLLLGHFLVTVGIRH